MPAKEDKIKEHAYTIWEQEGRPHGRHEDHWRKAEKKLAGASDADSDEETDEKNMAAEDYEAEVAAGNIKKKGKNDNSSQERMQRNGKRKAY